MNTSFAGNDYLGHEVFNQSEVIVLMVFSILCNVILGVPLNGYVLWLMFTGARETLASDILSFNLSLAETIFSLSILWFLFISTFKCMFCSRVFAFACGLIFTARPLFQCCICVEYYLGVVHPVLFLRFKPLRYKMVVCFVVWLANIICGIYYTLTLFSFNNLYIFFIQSVLFLFVMLFCCLSVLKTLKRPRPGGKETEKITRNTMKRKAFKIILLILVSNAVTLFLYIIVIPLQCCLEHSVFLKFFTFCIHFSYIAGVIQPLLYLNRSGKLPCFSKA